MTAAAKRERISTGRDSEPSFAKAPAANSSESPGRNGAAWVVICTVAGYWFGNLPVVRDNFSLVVLAIIFLSLLPAVWEIWKARTARKRLAERPVVKSLDA